MRRHPLRMLGAVVAGALGLASMAVPGNASQPAAAATFKDPVRVTPNLGGGYEPAVYTDDLGNIVLTAHKENFQLVVSPDPGSPTFTRSMSWDWYSPDGGKTFKNLPGLSPAAIDQHDFGDEGDLAFDDARHLYFTDTNVGDISITRWTVNGKGEFTEDYHRPMAPAGEPVDDRPWVTAHLNGHVFYFGNEGDRDTYVGGQGQPGSGNGPGRYTVYQSYDGGQTFNSTGYTLKSSGWCRPLAEPGTQFVYAICTNDGQGDRGRTMHIGKLFAFVSNNDGHTFSRYLIGYYHPNDGTQSWPTVAFGANHSIWALYVDAPKVKYTGIPVINTLHLYHSTDHGKTWTHQDITPMEGRYEYGWLSASQDGRRLGLGIYYRPNNHSDWRVYGGIWSPGQTPTLTSLDPKHPVQDKHCNEAPGDLLGSAFNPDGTLNVTWTRNTMPDTCGTVTFREIWFARSTSR